MVSGLLLPWKRSSSSRRKDWRIASEENEKIDKNMYPTAAAMIPITMVAGNGELIVRPV